MKEEVSLFLSMFLCGWAQTDNEPDKEENLLHTQQNNFLWRSQQEKEVRRKRKANEHWFCVFAETS